jgi:WD40 repeat protein
MKAMLYDKRGACVMLFVMLSALGIGRIAETSATAADFALQQTTDNKNAEPEVQRDQIFKIEGARWAVWSADRKVMALWFGRSEKRKDGGDDDYDYYTTIKIYDAATGAEKVTLGEAKNIGAQYMALSPDGSQLALSTRLSIEKGDNIEIWDTRSGQPRDTIKLDYGRGRLALAFSPDGKALAITYGGPPNKLSGGMRLVDIKTGKLLATSLGHKHLTVSVAFTSDGKLMATGGDQHDQQIRLWDGRTGKEVRAIDGGKGLFLSLAFSPDGALLAAADTEGGIRIWNTTTGAEGAPLKQNPSSAKEIAFSRDGRFIACARTVEKDKKQTGEVLLWDLRSGELLVTVESTASNSVSFAPNDRTLAVLTGEGVKLIDIGKFTKKKE